MELLKWEIWKSRVGWLAKAAEIVGGGRWVYGGWETTQGGLIETDLSTTSLFYMFLELIPEQRGCLPRYRIPTKRASSCSRRRQ